ncbi:hypothetical protein ADL15_40395 [Actinoplanes awajinensis subsp. mycoplanecinus]|uniref:Uncharacterized protein n=1 Tax=Actinoplanes awajinensis subsp. mycoplanecinus TaxID=135947 RepID=A0A101JF63_9ACTN|nr:hypothetical protein ADL15_40395 [Actinoplanes awajinensis subsp. mycoplanecinus]
MPLIGSPPLPASGAAAAELVKHLYRLLLVLRLGELTLPLLDEKFASRTAKERAYALGKCRHG